MANPIEKSIPFAVKLEVNERYRLKDGQLVVEDKSIRSTASAWTRFWTRGQYSQTAILKEMGKLYKKAMKEQRKDLECHLTQTFLENYKTLKTRAVDQNEFYKDEYAIVRFFEAKSEIDISAAETEIKTIEKELAPKDPNSDSEKIKKSINDAKKQHEKALADEKQRQEKVLADTKKQHEKALADEKQRQDQDLAAKKQEAQRKIHEDYAAKLQESKDKLRALQEAGGPTTADIQRSYEIIRDVDDDIEYAKNLAKDQYDLDIVATKMQISTYEDALKYTSVSTLVV